MLGRLRRKFALVMAAFAGVAIVIALKLGAHWLNWEFVKGDLVTFMSVLESPCSCCWDRFCPIGLSCWRAG